MTDLDITFAPLLPWTLIWLFAGLSVLGVAVALRWRLAGWWLRALAFGVLVLALTNPQLRREERESLPNVAFLVVDRSDSTDLEDRSAQIETAAKELTTAVAATLSPSHVTTMRAHHLPARR